MLERGSAMVKSCLNNAPLCTVMTDGQGSLGEPAERGLGSGHLQTVTECFRRECMLCSVLVSGGSRKGVRAAQLPSSFIHHCVSPSKKIEHLLAFLSGLSNLKWDNMRLELFRAHRFI